VTNAPSPFRSGPSLPSSPLLSSPCPHSGHIFFFFLLNLQTGNSLSHNTQERRPLTPAQSRPPPALPAQASDARPRGAQGTPLSRWRHPSPGCGVPPYYPLLASGTGTPAASRRAPQSTDLRLHTGGFPSRPQAWRSWYGNSTL
jgi:hypothetical protein